MLYDSIHRRSLSWSDSGRIEQNSGSQGIEGVEMRRCCSTGLTFQLCKICKFWGSSAGRRA